MHILLTNDDGYDAPGLRALFDAVSGCCDATLTVVAPAEVQSGKGHIVSDCFRVRRVELPVMGGVHVVEGSPADCVRAAVGLSDLRRPDWVISGINRGSNLGIDIYNSGTVAAAREAGFWGIPALALSQYTKSSVPDDWPGSTRTAAAIIAAILQPDAPCPQTADPAVHDQVLAVMAGHRAGREDDPPHTWWNVNLACREDDRPVKGVKLTQVSREPYAIDYRIRRDGDSRVLCENVASYHSRPAAPGTDVEAVFGGWTSISRLDW